MTALHRFRPLPIRLTIGLVMATSLGGGLWSPDAMAQQRQVSPRVVATPGDHIVAIVNQELVTAVELERVVPAMIIRGENPHRRILRAAPPPIPPPEMVVGGSCRRVRVGT